jgi:hypothetical protein
MKNSEILLIGAAGIGIWYFMFGPGATPTPAVSLPSSAALALPAGSVTPLPLLTPAQTNPVAIPVPGANTMTQIAANSNATVAQQQTIFTWVNTMDAADQAAFYSQWGVMTAADVAGLMDLIVNEWQGGQPVTPARTAFWNAWRVKYGIDI